VKPRHALLTGHCTGVRPWSTRTRSTCNISWDYIDLLSTAACCNAALQTLAVSGLWRQPSTKDRLKC